MGNETSQLAGLEIDEKAVEVTDFWTHHSAVLNGETVTPLSVFIGEPLIGGSLWINQTPLEKATKNLMLHRHPSILKYISSWNRGSRLHLAVEYVKPLAHVLSTQTTLQICVGLHSVLKAASFLHEMALASHNNICTASIYVTQNGSWKLGGLEYLCRFEDMTVEYLARTRTHRYGKAVDPAEETDGRDERAMRSGAGDKYSFGVLVDEVLRGDVPRLQEFRSFCRAQLQDASPAQRPSLSSVLAHPFFSHDFIVVHSFLTELALKSAADRAQFFSGLADRLRSFPEEIVGRQLAELLLSRLVLLDSTARAALLPLLLAPRLDGGPRPGAPVFSADAFRRHVVPRLLHMFCVRDAQIRLLLLTHFRSYRTHFTREQLQSHVLPEVRTLLANEAWPDPTQPVHLLQLLIGIKDTSDQLVAVTLVALADLVPVLGAAAVIGGTRAKLFNDGRPMPHGARRSGRRQTRRSGADPLPLPERLSPDGGEDRAPPTEGEQSADDDLDNWSDWDVGDAHATASAIAVLLDQSDQPAADDEEEEDDHVTAAAAATTQTDDPAEDGEIVVAPTTVAVAATAAAVVSKKLPDILQLDIKNQVRGPDNHEEFDFFQDMEPVIQKTNLFVVRDNDDNDDDDDDDTENLSQRIKLDVDAQQLEEGWHEDLDWGPVLNTVL